MKIKFKRILIFGDNYGTPLTIKHVPRELIKGIVVSSIRPEYIKPISEIASGLGVNIIVQPRHDAKDYLSFLNEISRLDVDLIICNSYSMVVRNDVLSLVGYNAVNVHCSLLPENRGPNPLQWAIIKGYTQTGVTLHYMNLAIDRGDIIAQKKVDIDFEDTWVTLFDKVTLRMTELLDREIPRILSGTNKRYPQDEHKATCNKRLNPESPVIDFSRMSDTQVYNLIRAQVSPLKGAYLDHNGVRVYFHKMVSYPEIKKLREKYCGINN